MRYEQLTTSIERYEARVTKQSSQLERISQPRFYNDNDKHDSDGYEGSQIHQHVQVTAEDIQREETEVKELEKKKRGLEDRVSGYEKDIGGLLR